MCHMLLVKKWLSLQNVTLPFLPRVISPSALIGKQALAKAGNNFIQVIFEIKNTFRDKNATLTSPKFKFYEIHLF